MYKLNVILQCMNKMFIIYIHKICTYKNVKLKCIIIIVINTYLEWYCNLNCSTTDFIGHATVRVLHNFP